MKKKNSWCFLAHSVIGVTRYADVCFFCEYRWCFHFIIMLLRNLFLLDRYYTCRSIKFVGTLIVEQGKSSVFSIGFIHVFSCNTCFPLSSHHRNLRWSLQRRFYFMETSECTFSGQSCFYNHNPPSCMEVLKISM